MPRASDAAFGRLSGVVLRRFHLNRIPYLVYRVAPGLGRAMVRVWYQYITRFDPSREMVFMNYGYARPDGLPTVDLSESDEENRHCIQLYHHVAGGVDLTGKDVLEVGCGRGGGASYVARYRGPGSVTGIDIAARAIEFCREHHTAPNLGFQQGDAEALPFADGSFDAVINVESSHFYASMARFLAEVMRTLRPGGHFLFADFRNRHGTRNMRPQLERAGFEVLREERITTNILHALRLDSERKYGLIQARVPWFLRHVFREFASTDGTATYEAFRGRRWEYFSFVLRKNGAAS